MSNLKLMPILMTLNKPVVGCIGHNEVHKNFVYTEEHEKQDVINTLHEYKKSTFSHLYMISDREIRKSHIGSWIYDAYLKEIIKLTDELFQIKHTKMYHIIEASTYEDMWFPRIPRTALIRYVHTAEVLGGELIHPMYVTLTNDADDEGSFEMPLNLNNSVMVELTQEPEAISHDKVVDFVKDVERMVTHKHFIPQFDDAVKKLGVKYEKSEDNG